MRILVITHSYYPKHDPRAFRWSAVCEHWAQNGIIVDVVCAYANATLARFEQIRGVNVYRVVDPSQRFVPVGSASTGYQTASSKTSSWLGKIKQFAHPIIKKIVITLRWPDYAWLWIPGAYRQIVRLVKTHHYDGIFSSAVPFSSHIPVMMLGQKRKNISWVCDYGDPFSCLRELPMNNTKLYQGLNRWVESKVINASKKISVTTRETAQEYIKYLGVCDKWLHVIPPLVKSNYIYLDRYEKEEESLEEKIIHLVFAGTLYAKIRNPRFLLELLSEIHVKMTSPKFIIHFYGKIGDCEQEFEPYKKAINDWIYFHGSVDRDQLIKVYRSADILVNIGNTTTYQVPSKVIEYMSTGLPILNITSVANDSSILMLQSYPSVLTLSQNAGVTEKIVDEFCLFMKQSQNVDREVVEDILRQYQPTTIANAYLSLLS
ncbi:Uncharacterised protein [Legionella lansingensis]|uniref:Glycosyltransferase subfamily 4-like N-terminal domain-containing protein n=1 Tax=Legionella lansingensis TaxID=45067 RepID=A0A0W0VWK4_9GAMM|nr:glycosyltransferase [Legionella lansingensis]KTD24334.1 hypothetical protein Llan_0473 [Legionella lansingensis]SNV51758.1 Uncharacterised protein [Legionella lansingensis]